MAEGQRMEFLGVKVEPELRERIEAAARDERRSLSGFVRNVVSTYFEHIDGQSNGKQAA